MKTDREKLINWIRNTYVSNSHYTYKATVDDTADAVIADILIANSVVVQRWIPVTEQLPGPFVSVLVQMPGEAPCPTVREGFVAKDGSWYAGLYHREPDEVTHWMPLPEPPKEDE